MTWGEALPYESKGKAPQKVTERDGNHVDHQSLGKVGKIPRESKIDLVNSGVNEIRGNLPEL